MPTFDNSAFEGLKYSPPPHRLKHGWYAVVRNSGNTANYLLHIRGPMLLASQAWPQHFATCWSTLKRHPKLLPIRDSTCPECAKFGKYVIKSCVAWSFGGRTRLQMQWTLRRLKLRAPWWTYKLMSLHQRSLEAPFWRFLTLSASTIKTPAAWFGYFNPLVAAFGALGSAIAAVPLWSLESLRYRADQDECLRRSCLWLAICFFCWHE